ncbi:MAG: V-type ATP synthase subunit K [Candidatus Omnitrophota bacterium]|nr:V-type ATP synthase subunit K [Candidatus Omnitrophota bacterium]MBU3929943.1 V-type ATP synthase subunit K [bacterium]MBU4122667.1 V-type ATP synthase subunit K [bacterium]
MDGLTIALFGAGIAVFLGGIGSAVGVSTAGQAAAGVLSEKPEKFGETFILVALPGTQGIYGFAVGFMAILKLGLLGGGTPAAVSVSQGLLLLAACIPVGVAGLLSGIYQGRVCASGIGIVAKQEGKFGLAVIYGILVETYALLGFVTSILVVLSVQL